MMKSKRLLFGGALMAAGLAAQSADADFSFTYSYVLAGAYDYGGFGPYFDVFVGPGTWSVLAEDSSGGDFAAGASTSTSLSMSFNAFSTGGASGVAYMPFSYFTVTSDATADVSWDFDAGAGLGLGFVYLFNITDGIFLVSETAGAGATSVSLEVGKEYSAAVLAFSFDEIKGKSFVEIVIPAPAALPLLAAGGLATVSRRRRRA